jgi:hypothetical protein
VSVAIHEELLRQGPRDAVDPTTIDEVSQRVAREVSAVPTLARIAAGAVVLLEVAKYLGGTIAVLAWLAVAVIAGGEWLRSWIKKLEERR